MPLDAIAGDKVAAVEIRLSKLQQLFNSFDPSPFHEKELDPDAEEYIVSSVDEFPLARPLKLVIHLPDEELRLADSGKVSEAIHNYFNYRLAEARRRLRFQFREGRIALLIGLWFLFACMLVRQITTAWIDATVSQFLAEGLLILGWVAMWRPLQIFLYDWWPVRHHSALYAKLARMNVELQRARSFA